MKSNRTIQIVSCHAEGEVGNVIIGGVGVPPGNTIWEQSRWIHEDQSLRQFVLNEPRGGVFKHINLLVPPKSSKAVQGFIVMSQNIHLQCQVPIRFVFRRFFSIRELFP